MNNKIREAIALYISKTSKAEVSEVLQANIATVTSDKVMFRW